MTARSHHLSMPSARAPGAAHRHGEPDWATRAVLALAFLGAVALASLPQARASAAFGSLPLWLAVLPASAWLALAFARGRSHRG